MADTLNLAASCGLDSVFTLHTLKSRASAQHRVHGPTRTAPRCPEVHQHWTRLVQHFALEVVLFEQHDSHARPVYARLGILPQAAVNAATELARSNAVDSSVARSRQ